MDHVVLLEKVAGVNRLGFDQRVYRIGDRTGSVIPRLGNTATATSVRLPACATGLSAVREQVIQVVEK
jgi:hypothetical protein